MLRWLTATILTLAAAASSTCLAPSAVASPLFGINDNVHVSPLGPERALDLDRRLGSDVVRASFLWRAMEHRPGVYNWSTIDRVHDLARARGLRLIAIVIGPPEWAADPGFAPRCSGLADPGTCYAQPARSQLPALQRFVQLVVERYPDLVAVEAFNEPNLGYWWAPQPDPEYFTTVMRAMREGIARSAHPQIPLVLGGLAPVGSSSSDALTPEDFLRRVYAAGGKGVFDGIGIHPYPGGSAPDNPAISTFHQTLSRIRGVRGAAGDAETPLWISEVGIATNGRNAQTPAEQARRLVRVVEDGMAMDDVRAVILHTLSDPGPDQRGDAWGLVTSSGTPKPAFEAVRTTIERIRRDAGTRLAAEQRARARRTAKKRASSQRAAARLAARTCRPGQACITSYSGRR